jgi:hypothetical protein
MNDASGESGSAGVVSVPQTLYTTGKNTIGRTQCDSTITRIFLNKAIFLLYSNYSQNLFELRIAYTLKLAYKWIRMGETCNATALRIIVIYATDIEIHSMHQMTHICSEFQFRIRRHTTTRPFHVQIRNLCAHDMFYNLVQPEKKGRKILLKKATAR